MSVAMPNCRLKAVNLEDDDDDEEVSAGETKAEPAEPETGSEPLQSGARRVQLGMDGLGYAANRGD